PGRPAAPPGQRRGPGATPRGGCSRSDPSPLSWRCDTRGRRTRHRAPEPPAPPPKFDPQPDGALQRTSTARTDPPPTRTHPPPPRPPRGRQARCGAPCPHYTRTRVLHICLSALDLVDGSGEL